MANGFHAAVAKRQRIKLKIGISGPSGAGKTFSSLLLARGLASDWSKVFLIDTENESASNYADTGSIKGWMHVPFAPPYTPERFIEAINYCVSAGAEAIIIDSTSHEWEGPGGCLDIVSQLGGRVTDWSKVTPRHRNFIQAMLLAPAHIIGTVRKKTEWEIERNEKGKVEGRKVGLADVQRQGLEYEWSLAFTLSVPNNFASCDKDRTGIFFGKPEFKITEDTGRHIMTWVNEAEERAERQAEKLYANSDEADKRWLRGEFETRKTDRAIWSAVAKALEGKPCGDLEAVISAQWQNHLALLAAESDAAHAKQKAEAPHAL